MKKPSLLRWIILSLPLMIIGFHCGVCIPEGDVGLFQERLTNKTAIVEYTEYQGMDSNNLRVFEIQENDDHRYDIGYTLGQRIRENIPDVEQKIWMYLEVASIYHQMDDITVITLNERARTMQQHLESSDSFVTNGSTRGTFYDEIKGFADGVDNVTNGGMIEPIHILKTSLFMDIFQVYACTGIGTTETPDGRPLVGRNMDWPSGNMLQKMTAVFVWHTMDSEGNPTTIVNPSFIALLSMMSGMNSKGLTVDTLENVQEKLGLYDSYNSTLKPVLYANREALIEHETTQDLVGTEMANYTDGYYTNNDFPFNNGSNNIYTDSHSNSVRILEKGLYCQAVRGPGWEPSIGQTSNLTAFTPVISIPQWAWLTNHNVKLAFPVSTTESPGCERPGGIDNYSDVSAVGDINSIDRFNRVATMIQTKTGSANMSLDDIQDILTDEWCVDSTDFDKCFPIFYRLNANRGFDQKGTTLMTTMYDPANGKARIFQATVLEPRFPPVFFEIDIQNGYPVTVSEIY